MWEIVRKFLSQVNCLILGVVHSSNWIYDYAKEAGSSSPTFGRGGCVDQVKLLSLSKRFSQKVTVKSLIIEMWVIEKKIENYKRLNCKKYKLWI